MPELITKRFIREARYGPPKSGKTWKVVSTYPKPMLVMEYDTDGLTVIDTPIVYLKPDDLATVPKELPPICAFDFSFPADKDMSVEYKPAPNKTVFDTTVQLINKLRVFCPWKTVVIDTVTGLSDSIYSHQAITNPGALADARKWAGNIGLKVKQVIDYLQHIKSHTVVIMHSEVNKNEDLGIVAEQAMVYSKLRDYISALFSQFFYAKMEGGRPVILTQPIGFIRDVGCRWPKGLGATHPADFDSIYSSVKDQLA